MSYKFFITGISLLFVLSGCSSVWMKSPGKAASSAERRNVLTSFSVAVKAGDFPHAISMLTDWERSNLMGRSTAISKHVKEKLTARSLPTLVSNKRVTVIGGKISGIFFHLPTSKPDLTLETERIPVISRKKPEYATLSLE